MVSRLLVGAGPNIPSLHLIAVCSVIAASGA